MSELHRQLLEQMELTEQNLIAQNRFATEYLEIDYDKFSDYSIDSLNSLRVKLQRTRPSTLFNYIKYAKFSMFTIHNDRCPEYITFMNDGTISWQKRVGEQHYNIAYNLANTITSIKINLENCYRFPLNGRYLEFYGQNENNDWNISFASIKTSEDNTILKGCTVINGKNYSTYQINYESGVFSVTHITKKGNHTPLGDFVIPDVSLTMKEYDESLNVLLKTLGINVEFKPDMMFEAIKHIMGNIPVPAIEEALRTITNTPQKSSRTRKRN